MNYEQEKYYVMQQEEHYCKECYRECSRCNEVMCKEDVFTEVKYIDEDYLCAVCFKARVK